MRLVRTLAFIALIGAVTAILLGFLGRWGQFFDAFSHFRMHLVAVGLVACAFVHWTGARKSWIAYSMLAFAFGGVSILSVTQNEFSAYAEAPFKDTCLKVLTLNIWGHNSELHKVEAFLRQADADIVVLQEARDYALPILQNLDTLYPHQIHCAEDRWCGAAVLSKYAWTEADIEPYSGTNRAMAWARFGEGEEALFILGLHPNQPIPGLKQSVHYQAMAEFLIREEARTKIVGGDFNATPWSYAIQNFSRRTGLKRANPDNPFLMTWPSFGSIPQFAIDHIFVSNDIRVLNVERGPYVGSDHYPMIAEIMTPNIDSLRSDRRCGQ